MKISLQALHLNHFFQITYYFYFRNFTKYLIQKIYAQRFQHYLIYLNQKLFHYSLLKKLFLKVKHLYNSF